MENTQLNVGVGGDVIATDDIEGVKYQRVKLVLGDDGNNDGDVHRLNPIPVIGNVDAFYRERVSMPQTIFDSKMISDNQPLIWDDAAVSGTGTSSTYNANQASVSLGVSANTAGRRVRQTFRWFNYQPGKSQLFAMTGVLGAAKAGITKRIGMFYDNNGLFFESTSTGVGVVERSYATGSVVDIRANQSTWNIDKMDGTGASGINLDFTKDQIFFCDFEWLGVGTVQFGFYVNRVPIYCHAFHHANLISTVYMSTPNLPLRYEIINDGTGAADVLLHICSTVITEGGRQNTGVQRSLNRGINTLTTLNDNDIYPLIGLRLKTTHLGAQIQLVASSILCSSSAIYAYYTVESPTIAGTAPTWIDLDNSPVQYCYPTNATKVSGGVSMQSGLASDTNQMQSGANSVQETDLMIGSNIAGVPQELFLCVQQLNGTTETFYSSLTWRETN